MNCKPCRQLLLLLVLAGCCSHEWPGPGVSGTPQDLEAGELVERAREAERNGDDVQAYCDYREALRHDRWQPAANVGYQDLMLRHCQSESIRKEYLELRHRNPERGDALWFCIRPLLQQRSLRKRGNEPALTADERREVDDLILQAIADAGGGPNMRGEARLKEALAIADLPEIHRQRILMIPREEFDHFQTEYAERAAKDREDGDALAMEALAISHADPAKALDMLLGGWIREIAGYWLEFEIAEIAQVMATQAWDQRDDLDKRRSIEGHLKVAEAMYERCQRARPSHTVVDTGLAEVHFSLKELEKPLR